ncbi:hypothetical protein Q5424_18205, partial [Conexibacter sp. JD483]|uniref:hypothetical protein n=1 Tax=Conexibacter sp. JD483 TaxID=3064471 RepID=UPI0028701784
GSPRSSPTRPPPARPPPAGPAPPAWRPPARRRARPAGPASRPPATAAARASDAHRERAQCTRGSRAGSFKLARGIQPRIATRSGRSAFAVSSRDGGGRRVKLAGKNSGAGLRGTLRVSWRDRTAGRCDSGTVRWSAKR